MNLKILISETTREEREDMVDRACGLASLGGTRIEDEEKSILQPYIDGIKEIEDIKKEYIKSIMEFYEQIDKKQ